MGFQKMLVEQQGKLLCIFNKYFSNTTKQYTEEINKIYNPKSPVSFYRWARSICLGRKTAIIYLHNPLLIEFILLFKEFGWKEEDVLKLKYINYLEYINFINVKNSVEQEELNKHK